MSKNAYSESLEKKIGREQRGYISLKNHFCLTSPWNGVSYTYFQPIRGVFWKRCYVFVREIVENHLLQSSLKADLEARAFNMLNVHSVTDDLLGFYRTNEEHFFKRTTVYFLLISLEQIRVKFNLY